MEQRQLPISTTLRPNEEPRGGARGSESDLRDSSIPLEIETDSRFYAIGKRTVDIVGSLLALVLFGWLMCLIAIVVKLTSPGPVIYRQTRVGLGGRPFTFYKFRSMIDGAEALMDKVRPLNTTGGPTFKHAADPRMTPVGRVLRRTSMDELPQLFNVLRGDMSLVGPRPPLPSEVREYRDGEWKRLGVKPGITCLWQVNGRSNLCFAQQVELDLEYIRRRSILLDLYILLKTIPAVIFCRGAC